MPLSVKRRHQLEALPSQKRFLAGRAKFMGFSGPVGTGKTHALCCRGLISAAENPGVPGVLAAPTYPMLHDVTIPTMLGILEERGIPHRYTASPLPRVVLKRSKTEIWFRSLDNPNRLRGMNIGWFGIDELTYTKPAGFAVLKQRIRHPHARRAHGFAVWTPKGYDWVYQLFISPKREDAIKRSHQAVMASPRENIVVLDKHPDYYDQLQQSYDDLFFRQEVLGEYLNIFAGRVYHAFSEEINEVENLEYAPQIGGIGCAMDFNIDPMAWVITQAKASNRLEVLRELTVNVGTLQAMCERFERETADYVEAWRAVHGATTPLPVKMYGDASGSHGTLVGKTTYAIIKEFFRDRGDKYKLDWQTNVSNPPVVDRVNSVNSMLRNASGQSRLFIDGRCKELIADLYEVSWREDNQTEIDKKTNRRRTHWSDALGYEVYKDHKVSGFERSISKPNEKGWM